MSIKNRTIAVVCGLALATTALAPAAALAANKPVENSNSGTTDVTIQVEKGGTSGQEDQLAFEVPTEIPFAAKHDGTLVGPSADKAQIVNKSVFPIHVTKMAVAQQDPFHIVDDVATSTGTNDVQFTVHGAKAGASVNLLANTAWNMGYAGTATDRIGLDTTDAKIARVTANLSTPQKAATITWTLAAGSAQ